MIKIKEELQTTKEDLSLVTNTLERNKLMSSLNNKLWTLQGDIQSLHEMCRNQGRTLEVEALSIHEMEGSISLCKQQLQAEFGCCNQTRQIQLHQLNEKLLALQQELEIRTEELQSSYCSLLQYQSILDKQTCDLEMLHQHCQMKEDEVTIYEEEMEKNKEDNKRLQEKLQISQEQLALAENRIISLESSLTLYKDKYQAAVKSLELLECQMKALERDIKIISMQEEDGKGDQPKERMAEYLIYELKETQKRLHDALQNGSEQEDTLQELRHKLVCSNLKILDHEETLIKLEVDFATYRMSHRQLFCPPDESEDIKQILAHIEEQCEYQCIRVEEYQYLLKDMKKELEKVSEQKKKIMKDLMKLELDMHNLLQETATQTEWKDGEAKDLKRHIRNLEGQLKECQSLCLENEKVIQKKDEALFQTNQEIIQAQHALDAKDSDIEKQKARVEEVEHALQKVKEKKEKSETQNAALDAKVQQLQHNLNEAHQGQLLLAQKLSCVDKQTSMLKDSLDCTQRKLEDKIAENMEKKELIDKLSSELKGHQKDKSTLVDLLETERKNIEMLTSELEVSNRKHHDAEKEITELQKSVDDMKLQLCKSQEKMKELIDELEEECYINESLRKQLKQLEREREDHQDLRLTWKNQEKELKDKIEALKKEIQDDKKLEMEKLSVLEHQVKNLRDQQKHPSQQRGTQDKLEAVVMLHLSEEEEDGLNEPEDEDENQCLQELSKRKPRAAEKIQQQVEKDSPKKKLSATEKIMQKLVGKQKERLKELEDENQSLRDKMQYYSLQLDSTTVKFACAQKIQEQAEKEKDRLHKLEDENQYLRDRMQYYSLQLDSATKKISVVEKIQEQAEKKNDRLNELENENQCLRDKMQCYLSQLDSATRKCSDAEKKMQEQEGKEKARLNELQDENQCLRDKMQCYLSQLDSATRKCSDAEKKMQEQEGKEKARLNELQDENQCLRDKMQCYSSQLDSATRKLRAAEKQIQEQAEKEKNRCYEPEEDNQCLKVKRPLNQDSFTRKCSCSEKNIQQQAEKEKEKVCKLELENEILRGALKHCTNQRESATNKLETAKEATKVKENEVVCQKEALTHVQKDLQEAEKQEQKNNLRNTHSCLESARTSSNQDKLKEALEKLSQAKLEAATLRQELQKTQQKKSQLEEETCAYKHRMKKLNGELRKLQDFHQQSEKEVDAFVQQIEDMNYQLAFWQKTHENDLQFLAAKDEQLVVFKVEMASLKENLREEEKKVEALRNTLESAQKDTWKFHQENEMVASDVHQWVKEQKDNTEKLGSKIREQVKCIYQLAGEKDHLHNVMVHLQHENKKLRKEIDDRRQQNEHLMQ